MAHPNPVLITGGAGYIGSHAVLAFRDAGTPVVVLDDLSTGRRERVPEDVPLVEGDAGDGALVGDLIAAHGIAAVVHFAGSIVVPESMADPLKYYRNNTCASRALIEACVAGGVRRFVFSSTAAVYGMPAAVPIPEDAPTVPINPYGASKLMTEWILRDTAAAQDFQAKKSYRGECPMPVARPHDPEVQANGNLLIPHTGVAGMLVETDPMGPRQLWQKIWLPDTGTYVVRDANRWPNGNILISSGTRLFEMTTLDRSPSMSGWVRSTNRNSPGRRRVAFPITSRPHKPVP